MANNTGRIAYCARCNAYGEHRADPGPAGPIGYRCLVCGHPSDPAERCRHAPACQVSGAKAARTPPDMWLRLGEQQGTSVGRARAERRRREDRRDATRTAAIIGGAALLLIFLVCGYLNWQHK